MAEPTKDYLIAPARHDESDPILAQVKDHIEQDPDASLAKDRQKHLVATMTDEAVDRLRSTFDNKLTIEPDSELKY